MKVCNYIIFVIIAILIIVAIVIVTKGGITGKVAVPKPCADIGIQGGYDVLPEYLIEFESNGFKCFEGPMENGYCCIK